MIRAYVAISSGLGDSPGYIRAALERLRTIGVAVANSDLYRTRPAADQPWSYHVVAEVTTELDARKLLAELRAIEQHYDSAARVLTLELLFNNGEARSDGSLDSSHLRRTPSILAPLAEIAPQLSLPPDGKTPAELLRAVPANAPGTVARVEGTATLNISRNLDYDAIGEAGTSYRALRPLTEFNQAIFDAVGRAIGLQPGMKVLDAGCGTGRFSELLAARGAFVTGLDRSANMLAAARGVGALESTYGSERLSPRGTVEYIRGDANVALPGGPYDAIVFFFSVHYMALDRDFWERLRAALTGSGTVAFATFPHRHFIETEHTTFFPAIPRIDMARFPSLPQLVDRLRENGFVNIQIQEIIEEDVSSPDDLIARTQARYLSTFHLLSDEEFARGVAAMREAYRNVSTVRRTIQAAVVSARAA